jgi:hypothetical protein
MTEYFDPDLYADATIVLNPINGTFTQKKVAIPEGKSISFGRLTQDITDSPILPKFQSKVVSRQHCSIFNNGGKFFVKDTGSSSGTFLQNPRFGDKPYRLSEQGKESTLFELHDGDMLQLGEDYDQGGVFHKSIQMKLIFPQNSAKGDGSNSGEELEGSSSFVDYSADPDVRREVEDEFNALWASLISPLSSITPRASSSFNIRKVSSEKMEPAKPVPTAPVPSATPVSQPAQVEGVNPNECVAFIQSLTWETPTIQARLIELVQGGDTHILGFYRSLKQFPSAFKDVVTKYLQKKNLS